MNLWISCLHWKRHGSLEASWVTIQEAAPVRGYACGKLSDPPQVAEITIPRTAALPNPLRLPQFERLLISSQSEPRLSASYSISKRTASVSFKAIFVHEGERL